MSPRLMSSDRPLMIYGLFWFFREFQETRQAPNAAVLGRPSLAQPMETGMNGRLKTTATERPQRHRQDATVFSGRRIPKNGFF